MLAGQSGLAVDAIRQSDGGVIDHGRLVVVDNHVDDASGTVVLKAVFANPARLLWPGEMVAARLSLGTRPDAVTVPGSAIQRNVAGSYVWVVRTDGVVRQQRVVPGTVIGTRIVIARGLSGGENVVVDGQFGLIPGAHVTVLRPREASPAVKSDNPDRLGLQS